MRVETPPVVRSGGDPHIDRRARSRVTALPRLRLLGLFNSSPRTEAEGDSRLYHGTKGLIETVDSRTVAMNLEDGKEAITLGGGCFWCLQPIFQDLKGVEKVEVGYAGGHTKDPTYEDVCTDSTGHAEAVQVTYDPKTISTEELLTIFFTVHDPTTLNRKGHDEGSQYRSAVYYHTPAQKAAV